MKRNKYKNIKSEYKGQVFDSLLELSRFKQLELMEKAGAISSLETQPSFLLIDTIRTEKETLSKVSYKADFKYYDNTFSEWVVEDVKGVKTAVYQLKKRLFLQKYGDKYKFREIFKV